MAYAYPILLDLAGKLVVIVGGGKVALRKARGVIEAGAAQVRCIAPQIEAEMPKQVERVQKQFEAMDLQGAGLVFAATDSAAVNSAVVRAARERGILVCRADADEQEEGDFALPAVCRSGPIVLGVWTGNPSLSVILRDALRTRVEDYKEMAEVLTALRPRLKSSKLAPMIRMQAMIDLVSPPALEEASRHGIEGLWRWLVEKYPELKLEQAP